MSYIAQLHTTRHYCTDKNLSPDMQTKQEKPHKVMLLWLLGGDFASLSLWLDGNNLYVINYTQSIFHSAVTSLDGYKDHFCLIQV